ncbi:unnamed protein product [Dibothriocephalus latus]|uniref:Uncharacterized protein n=1 Tax=Dibothriocephalus latus TaxID=60516 RepID=A0A3P7MAB1_DIBLA|nr:unnamed protein product [Dibothriocephalus latus]
MQTTDTANAAGNLAIEGDLLGLGLPAPAAPAVSSSSSGGAADGGGGISAVSSNASDANLLIDILGNGIMETSAAAAAAATTAPIAPSTTTTPDLNTIMQVLCLAPFFLFHRMYSSRYNGEIRETRMAISGLLAIISQSYPISRVGTPGTFGH